MGQKRATFSIEGFQWGSLGGGGLFLQQQQHEVGGVGGGGRRGLAFPTWGVGEGSWG